MELKFYQQQVIYDLAAYLSLLGETKNISMAYEKHWSNKDVKIGQGGMPQYQNNINDVPHVCFKVPTGGGKTFLACASAKPIFETVKPFSAAKLLVWLVPSNAILEQTVRALSDTSHPYRQRLDRDFASRVEVYTKEQLLCGQNFTPSSVSGQLSVCVLSYDSLRSGKKDGRKVYQENSQLTSFVKGYETPETLVQDIDDTALIQVLNQLTPVVIVDESHNAQSDLSVEMLKNLNPIFVLDLTATPKNNSNIISYVDARELKKENMVKLPVIVYNRKDKNEVLADAVNLRMSIELQAQKEEADGGRYIRPIVLFQAQSKTSDESETFKKLKESLIEAGINKDEIAIKTSEINELKGVNLMSRECKIRYIITVNALKEGWDCPFAYILATLANKTSKIDVEQIVGRVLRQPYAKQHSEPLLNNSYILTCSASFTETLENIVSGLNQAGFSRRDMRTASEEISAPTLPNEPPEQGELPFDLDKLKGIISRVGNLESTENSEMIEQAERQSEDYQKTVEEIESSGLIGGALGEMTNQFKIQPEFFEEAAGLKIPQFFFKTEKDMFHEEGFTLVRKEKFTSGFSLKNADANISFELSTDAPIAIDIKKTGEAVPKYQRMSKKESEYIRGHLSTLTPEARRRTCIGMMCDKLNKIDSVETRDLQKYVERIVDGMKNDEVSALNEISAMVYAEKIRTKIEMLQAEHGRKEFEKQIDTGEVVCQPGYSLPHVITSDEACSALDKSLYEFERKMNDFEHEVISTVAKFDNIKWWHKISERRGFFINGFIHHYPDFMVMTERGNILIIEVKGDYLANDDSRDKLHLGRAWADKAGDKFRYFMVFKDKGFEAEGAYTLDGFISIIQKI